MAKRNGTMIEYRNYKLQKNGHWMIITGGRMVGYGQTLADAKKAVDRRIEGGK